MTEKCDRKYVTLLKVKSYNCRIRRGELKTTQNWLTLISWKSAEVFDEKASNKLQVRMRI